VANKTGLHALQAPRLAEIRKGRRSLKGGSIVRVNQYCNVRIGNKTNAWKVSRGLNSTPDITMPFPPKRMDSHEARTLAACLIEAARRRDSAEELGA